jgi:putative ABC transport system permease protein
MPALEGLASDLRLGLRSLARTPGFTAAAVLAMALGIGGTSAIFAGFDTLLLRPLPFPAQDRLVALYERTPDGEENLLSPPDYRDLSAQTPSVESAGAYYSKTSSLMTAQGPQQVELGAVTASFLPTLGVQPALGRGFTADEEPRGRANLLILTDGAWRRRFGATPDLVGKSVNVDGQPFTVVGVLPRGFAFPGLPDAEGFVPLGLGEIELRSRGNHFLMSIARLRPGTDAHRASAELQQVAGRLAAAYPATNNGTGAFARGLLADSVRDIEAPLAILLAAVAALLLVSCANVAGMLLARGASRQREVAIRAALGGGRFRIVRQLLVESAALGGLGGALGLFLAVWGVDALVALAPEGTPRLSEVHLDLRVTAFTVLLSVAVGLLAGVAPALQTSRPDLTEAMREGGQHGSASRRKARARSLLVVVEVALALSLVVVAGLLTRSLARVLDTRLGFDPANVLTVRLTLPPAKYRQLKSYSDFNARLVERVSALPGVQSAATVNAVPLTNAGWDFGFVIEGKPPPPPGLGPDSQTNWVSPGFFRTMRMPIVEGRDFAPTDSYQSPKVIVVNQAFARRFFKGERALGQHIHVLASFQDEGNYTWEIVGVVGDIHEQGLDQETRPAIYFSQTQQGFRAMNLVLRATGSQAELARAVRAEVLALDPEQAIGRVQTMDDLVSASVGSRRFQALLCGAFGLLAVVLAALGLYGLIAWSVAQRTQEIGIRMALGAPRGSVLRMVVLQGLELAGIGLGLGLAGALAASRALQAQLYGVSATDPLTYAALAALVTAVAALASFVPARRAATIDPQIALKSE